MSLQNLLNQKAFSFLPKIKSIIDGAPSFEANQMYCHTLHKCLNSSGPLICMNENELEYFQNSLIETFKHNEWVKA